MSKRQIKNIAEIRSWELKLSLLSQEPGVKRDVLENLLHSFEQKSQELARQVNILLQIRYFKQCREGLSLLNLAPYEQNYMLVCERKGKVIIDSMGICKITKLGEIYLHELMYGEIEYVV